MVVKKMVRNYSDIVVRYFRFSLKEVEELLTIALIFAFSLTFTDWGRNDFDFLLGLRNLGIGFVIVLISIFVHHGVKKLAALAWGYSLQHTIWTAGLSASLIITLLTNGRLPLFFASSFEIATLSFHRLGTRKGPHIDHIAFLAMIGLLASAVLAMLGFLLNDVFHSYAWEKLITFNGLYIIYNVLPLPQLDGIKIFFASRLLYTFTTVSALVFFILALFAIPSLILALGAGLIATVVFYLFYERTF